MGHNLATWKTLEDMMIELKKKGVAIPANVMEDLRAAKSMIQLSGIEVSHGDAVQKAEQYLANVEVYLVTEGQKVFGIQHVDRWLQVLEEASTIEECQEPEDEGNFVTGVPRDQKWVRVQPTEKLSTAQILQLARKQNLQTQLQKDDRILIYGAQKDIKEFLKQMTAQTTK